MTDIAGERRRLAEVGHRSRLREEWGARFDGYASPRPVDAVASQLFLHIAVVNLQGTDDATMRLIEKIGISRFPQTGVSYNGAVTQAGRPFELQPLTRRGAHTANDKRLPVCILAGCPGRGGILSAPSWNNNVTGRAIVLPQNVGHVVTDAQVHGIARMAAAWKLAGFVARGARWHGHRCVSAKLCPGDRGFARLPEIADWTEHYVRVGLGSTPPSREWDEMVSQDEFVGLLRSEMAGQVGPLAERVGQLARAAAPVYLRLRGTAGAYIDGGTWRRRVTGAYVSGTGGRIVDVDIDDPIWSVPLVGPEGEVFARPGEAAFWRLVAPDGRAWVRDGAELRRIGSPIVTRLGPNHPFWARPVVGDEPPAVEGDPVEDDQGIAV